MNRCSSINLPKGAALPPTLSTLWLPQASLAACVRAVVLRDTRGVALRPQQRLNHFGASPYFTLTWFFEGSGEAIVADTVSQVRLTSPRHSLPGPILLTGPADRPRASYNPGQVHALMLVFMPDALYYLTGLRADDWIECTADARQTLPPDWAPWLDQVLNSPSVEYAVHMIEDFLGPRWANSRPSGRMYVPVEDWLQSLAMRLVMSGTGRSLRQLERRFRTAVGQSFRTLRIYARNERSYLQTRQAYFEGRLEFAEAAYLGGYADQSHMIRETVRATGFTPVELARHCETEESFWIYRLWQ